MSVDGNMNKLNIYQIHKDFLNINVFKWVLFLNVDYV